MKKGKDFKLFFDISLPAYKNVPTLAILRGSNVRLGILVFIVSFISFNSFTQAAEVKFRFPIAHKDRDLIKRNRVYGFDNDPRNRVDIFCRNHQGRRFPHCYDGHKGTDFMLLGGFSTMDKGSAEVVAAEAGVVTRVVDGNYDRCRVSYWRGKVTCHGHPMKSNYVEIKHADGKFTRYLHLKKNSTLVKVGDQVRCGQTIGLVGSSGWSSAPHLHFEVRNAKGVARDPYSGVGSQKHSDWKLQRDSDGLPGDSCN